MEDIKQFCKRTRSTKQRVSLWIQRGDLIAEKKGGVWVLLGLQAKPKPKQRGKGKKKESHKGLVKQYNLDGTYVGCYKSVKEAGETLNRCVTGISKAINTDSRTAYGFIWKRERLTDSE
tara:strand:+ start:21277 stop:21633 length:357 start_codon:yes stop_codon:yes gene_type:complete